MAVFDFCSSLHRLLSEGQEKSWLEFKHNASDPADIGKYISALSNAALLEGLDKAFLVFGIEDGTLRKVGTTFNPATMKKGNDALENWLSHKLDPPVKAQFHSFSCDELRFVIVEIEPSYFKPVRFEGQAYVRIGSHSKKLIEYPELERSLWLATGQRRFENAIAYTNASKNRILEVLDWRSYYLLSRRPVPVDPDEIVRTFIKQHYITDEYDGTFAITNLGALLWAKDVFQFPSVSSKTVRVIRYFGIDARNSGQVTEAQQGYGIEFVDLVKLVCQQTPQRDKIIAGVRRTIPVIPEISIREELGKGIDKAITAIESVAAEDRIFLAPPVFRKTQNGFTVILFGHKSFKELSREERLRTCYQHCVLTYLRNDFMNNSSLRERFSLQKDEYQAVSAVIADAIKSDLIVPADEEQGRKHARYIPAWAKQ